jgi:hypothetical protein
MTSPQTSSVVGFRRAAPCARHDDLDGRGARHPERGGRADHRACDRIPYDGLVACPVAVANDLDDRLAYNLAGLSSASGRVWA